jgi:FkbM family methyltransferase
MNVTDRIRAVVPRPIRNFLRGPSAAMRWLKNDLMMAFGGSLRTRIRPDWEIDCHPESFAAFEILKAIPETRDELEGFVARCTPDMVLVDVGAHFGIFTLAALRYGGRNPLVYAVEPAKVPLRVLRENVRLAHASERVTVLDIAVGPSDGELTMLTTGAHGGHFLIAADRLRPDATRVKQRALSTLFSQMSRPPTHLKMDIEGFEAEAIDGGLETLRALRPLFFLELHVAMLRARGQDPERVLMQLSSCGYTRFEVDGCIASPREIVTRPIARIVCSA